MRKTFKYRLYANKETIAKAENWLELCRWLYNSALAERIYAYRTSRKSLSYINQQNELPKVKEAIPELNQVGSHVLQNVLKRVDSAYKGFFRKVRRGEKGGFPRFRGKNRYDSITFPDNQNWRVGGEYLHIRNVGRFKLRLSRPIGGDIKTLTIRRTPTNKWYVCFSCDNVLEKRLPQSDKAIGLDVGIKSFRAYILDANSRHCIIGACQYSNFFGWLYVLRVKLNLQLAGGMW